MTKKKPTNTAASVRARLLSVAKDGGEDFRYGVTRYALERLMVRLVRSAHRAIGRSERVGLPDGL